MDRINDIASVIILFFSVITAFLTIIEKSQKVKWNPLSKITGKSEIVNTIKQVEDKIDKVVDRQDKLENQQLMNEYSSVRKEILNFASDLRNGIPKTHHQYEEYLDKTLSRYEELVATLRLKNGFAHEEIEYVKRKYQQLDEEGR